MTLAVKMLNAIKTLNFFRSFDFAYRPEAHASITTLEYFLQMRKIRFQSLALNALLRNQGYHWGFLYSREFGRTQGSSICTISNINLPTWMSPTLIKAPFT